MTSSPAHTVTLLLLIVCALWVFVGTFALACIVTERIGQRSARRRGVLCPACDYRGTIREVSVHRALDHDPRVTDTDWPPL